ncbi:hypothetical protein SAMN05216279_13027 [Pseudomonas oryzihabitans]|uniref:Uncharacterized protein n=1 Tax=Pseudomonas oryzihabitans TaxID=47885 RepID=A0A1G5PHZ7_9PSED|nr:hypothetical protein SAMN05216279_13027 [Pseudomonas psychrotolerans]
MCCGKRERIASLAINSKTDPCPRVKAQHLTDLRYRPNKACGFRKKFSSRAELAFRRLRVTVLEIVSYAFALHAEPVVKPVFELAILFLSKTQRCFW